MKALVTANFDQDCLVALETTLGLEVDYHPISARDTSFTADELESMLENVSVFIVGYEGVPASLMDAADSLEMLACPRGGPDANIDIGAATDRNIPVIYTPGRNAESVADFTMGLLLGVNRYIAHSHHMLQQGIYTGEPQADTSDGGEREDVVWGVGMDSPYTVMKGVELAGRTMGIVGFGDIGSLVAQRAQGFDMDVLAYDPYVDKAMMADHGVEKTELGTLCDRSDVVSVHTVVTPETRGLIGREEFDRMGDETFFVNTARASIADQEALIDAVRSGSIRGAALDVYENEPLPEDHELFELDTVVTTPHIAAATTDVIERHSEMILADLRRYLDGKRPENLANPDVELDLESVV